MNLLYSQLHLIVDSNAAIGGLVISRICRSFWLVVCGLLLVASHVGARTPVDTTQPVIDLQPLVDVYVDDAGHLSLEDVQALPPSVWRQSIDDRVALGFNRAVHWFKLDLLVEQPSLEGWLLELSYPLIDQVELFVIQNGKVMRSGITGDRVEFDQRPLDHRNFLFPLALDSAGELTLYLQVQTDGAMELPLHLWQKNAFIEAEGTVLALQSMYFGLMIGMLLYNLFIFLVLRDRSYFWYLGVTASIMLFQASLHGFGFQYLWPGSVWWQDQSVAVMAASSSAFTVLFARSFLGYTGTRGLGADGLKWLGVVSIAIVALTVLLPYQYAIRLAAGLGAITPILVMAAGISKWRTGSLSARYFTIAWSVFMAATVVLVLSKFGYIPSSGYTENAQQIGSAMEVLLLSIALAQRFSEERSKRLEAQEQALISERVAREAQQEIARTQSAAAERLEHRVVERTAELQSAMQQLSEANMLLRNLSSLDGLTGVHNRRAFDERFDLEWRRSQRNGTLLSLLLIDIDHFKKLNDSAGHLAGDECLRQVADCIKDSIRRPPDFCARFGGEEFVVILPETDAPGAVHTANRIRRSIESLDIRFNEHSLKLTASIGCCSLVPQADDDLHSLIECADKALYAAKGDGRNLVKVA
ncbi:7TM diverse intracellular signaling domain-containing protein [Allohahella sp. A8]|uniref:sensor domain-containing diguanylate cyclase n=1 Tax=Allohahella sp. A8 TaxID=3141461 RepID=UPI003A807D92